MPNRFLQIVLHPFKYRLFLLTRLPAAYFSGVRVRYADENKTVVTVPYKWFSANPFKSTYFACLSMAAEMSTGILAMAHVYQQKPEVSMLVMKIEGSFMKKAVGLTYFTCEDGQVLEQAVKTAMASGKSTQAAARSIGLNAAGEVIAEFTITWGFKTRPGRPAGES